MYNLPYFKENDRAAVLDFIQKHPFAFLCGCDARQRPVATQIPIFLEERDQKLFLSGHLMRQTDHHLAFENNPQVLCVFSGQHSYVSATWYSDQNQASTWNYMSAHLKGQIKFVGEGDLIEVLRKTSLHFENGNEHSPTVFDNLPDDYRNRLMKAIVAFEIEVTEMSNVFKLSQNRDRESYEHIIAQLKNQDADAKSIAEEMEKRKTGLFG